MTAHLRLAFLTMLFIMISPLISYSQQVTAVKGSRALINMGGLELDVGDRVYSVDQAGKRRAIMVVRQIRGSRAVLQSLKGRPAVGHTVIIARKAAKDTQESSGVLAGMKSGSAIGFTGALMMNKMKISDFNFGSPSQSTSFEMEGMNFGVGGFYDYPLTREWFVRAHGTLEMFDVSKKVSASICDGETTTDCNAKFLQVGLYGTFNYVFTPAPRRFWAGGGGGVLVYASKESTVLDTNKFFFNTVLLASGGVDFFLSRSTFIPVALEYQMIPDKEAGVTSMVLRAGWGKTF